MVTLDDCFRRSVLAFKSAGHWLRKMPRKGSDSKPVVTAPRWEEVQGKSRECLWWSANNISTIGLYCFTVAFIITVFTDFCNPDKLLLCPYDPHHLIRACRFPYHLIKCRKVRVQRPPQHNPSYFFMYSSPHCSVMSSYQFLTSKHSMWPQDYWQLFLSF